MNFKEYQKKSRKTAIYRSLWLEINSKGDTNEISLLYPALGLAGEAGEVIENVKRIIRDDNGVLIIGRAENIKKELGDTLWYLSQIATECKLDLEDIAKDNLKKLNDRLKRGVIVGEGNDR